MSKPTQHTEQWGDRKATVVTAPQKPKPKPTSKSESSVSVDDDLQYYAARLRHVNHALQAAIRATTR
jgi:predicted nucleic acid-binding Zn ribbon protein